MIRVLIVDDDPMVSEINQQYLESIPGFVCLGTASTTFEALEFMDAQTVDLVLLDIFMPGQNGLALLADIRKEDKSVDVIVITAASDIASIKTALRFGAVDYLIKPFEFERFDAALRAYHKEHEFLIEQEQMTQADLDKMLLHSNTALKPWKLPKGLTKVTLQHTVSRIMACGTNEFSTEEMANKVGISRISMRKYLSFLADLGFVSSNLHYRTAGRPTYRFSMSKENEDVVKSYL